MYTRFYFCFLYKNIDIKAAFFKDFAMWSLEIFLKDTYNWTDVQIKWKDQKNQIMELEKNYYIIKKCKKSLSVATLNEIVVKKMNRW